MSRQILSIGLSNDTNEVFKTYFALERLPLIACGDLNEAVVLMNKETFCLILLNVYDLTTDDAQNAVSKVRNMTYAPFLVLSKQETAASVLEVGADVCIPSTTDLCIIFSQAMALLRRYVVYDRYDVFDPDAATLYRGDLMIDSKRHRVTKAGEEVLLRPRELRLLAFFARNPGIVLTPDQIRAAVWLNEADDNRDVTPVITILRQKLCDNKDDPKYIETIRGVGYRFLFDA